MSDQESTIRVYHTLAQVAEICAAHGVKYAVLSPGSRSAPVALSFMRNTKIEHFVLADERSAAYTALGMAKQTQSPVVLVCTSGTAALNYAPAIAEAFFSEVPLIVFTADRPPEWTAQADNQSIYQENIYGKHAKANFNLPVDYSHPDAQWQAQRQVNEGLILSQTGKHGSVHFNVPLREPLYLDSPIKDIQKPKIIRPNYFATDSEEAFKFLTEKIKKFKKVVFVCGNANYDEDLVENTEYFCEEKYGVLLLDPASNLHNNTNAIKHSDFILDGLSKKEIDGLVPELVITFGGPIVSKNLKAFLRNDKIKEHWHISDSSIASDTFQKLTKAIVMDSFWFFEMLYNSDISFNEDYYEKWTDLENDASSKIYKKTAVLPYCESKAVIKILNALPRECVLHLGNSLPIRHVTSFPNLDNATEVYSNRGTSGIDGSLSTAAGQSMVDKRMHILILGDLSFLYDSNGLWNKYLKGNLKIIILNNYGGRIFESLPGAAKQAELEEYFVTEQNLSFEHTAKQHSIAYFVAENEEELEASFLKFFKKGKRPCILEVRIKDGMGLGEVKKYFKG